MLNSTTPGPLVPKSAMLPTLSSMVLIVSCCPERLPREHTPSSLVCILLFLQLLSPDTKLYRRLVLMMAETCLLAESAICFPPFFDELRAIQPRPTETVETVAIAAVAAATEQNASAILVLSTSGNTARLISKYRPQVPIITGKFTYSISTFFPLNIHPL